MITDAPRQEQPSIGDEFIQWAKNSWRLHELARKQGDGEESAPIESMMNAFVWKINSLIKERIGPL